MNQRLGETARQEILAAMDGLTGSAAKAEATRLADLFDVSISRIYSMTAHQRQGTRKRRSDRGTRKYDLVPGTDTWEAATLVIHNKLDPDQGLLTARANGHEDLPTLATMQKLLREKGLNRKARHADRRSHRRFEASAPLEMIQIDCTALKIRWKDLRTRRIMRIEGIDKNHPMRDETKVRVWQIMAVDDHSRRRYMRYVTTAHITSRDMVRFCCDLFCEWGLPLRVYTDNGPEFKGFFAQAVKILNVIPAVRDSGGFEHLKHAPNNAQASGKVENAHKWAEKMDKYVGLAESKGIDVTADKLDDFAEAICRHNNERRVHRETSQTPLARWFGTQVTLRMLPAEVIKSALLFEEAERVLDATMTVRVGKVNYRLPATGAPWNVGMRLSVIVPHELDVIFVTMPNGEEYEIEKVVAGADAAGDYKSAAPTEADRLRKELKAHGKEKDREARERRKTTGEVFQVPHFNHDIAAADTNVRHFPHPEIVISQDDIAAVTPVPLSSPPYEGGVAAASADGVVLSSQPTYVGRPINFWQAVGEFQSRFPGTRDEQIDAVKAFLEVSLFPGREGERPHPEVESAIDRYLNPNEEAERFRLVG